MCMSFSGLLIHAQVVHRLQEAMHGLLNTVSGIQNSPEGRVVYCFRLLGTLETDKAAAEDLIQQYLKEKAQQRVVADRGLQQGDVGIINMKIFPKGSDNPYPGLDKDKFAFDTSADPLGLTPVGMGF